MPPWLSLLLLAASVLLWLLGSANGDDVIGLQGGIQMYYNLALQSE